MFEEILRTPQKAAYTWRLRLDQSIHLGCFNAFIFAHLIKNALCGNDSETSLMAFIQCLLCRRHPSAIPRLIAAGWINAINGMKVCRRWPHI